MTKKIKLICACLIGLIILSSAIGLIVIKINNSNENIESEKSKNDENMPEKANDNEEKVIDVSKDKLTTYNQTKIRIFLYTACANIYDDGNKTDCEDKEIECNNYICSKIDKNKKYILDCRETIGFQKGPIANE